MRSGLLFALALLALIAVVGLGGALFTVSQT